jgi:ribosomal protein S18 acetylase RimI-like enzyme
MPRLVKRPSLEEILDFCAREPIERVFLEDVARRGLGRFAALKDGGELVAVCHLGANLVPSGEGTGAFAKIAARSAGGSAIRAATLHDLGLLIRTSAAAFLEEVGIDAYARDPALFEWRTRTQIEEGRSWLWEEGGTVLFKAEASAWTDRTVQLQQVWVDPSVRGKGYGKRGLADLCRLLLARTPSVCLFVRPENAPAIALYDSIGMRRVGAYRSLIFE